MLKRKLIKNARVSKLRLNVDEGERNSEWIKLANPEATKRDRAASRAALEHFKAEEKRHKK